LNGGRIDAMKTIAHVKTPKETYSKQTNRNNIGKNRAAWILWQHGYSVSFSPTLPYEKSELIAKRGNKTRFIQVKRISSRVFKTAEAARNRIRGKPFNVGKLPAGYELWVFDAGNNLFKFLE